MQSEWQGIGYGPFAQLRDEPCLAKSSRAADTTLNPTTGAVAHDARTTGQE